MIDKKTEVTPKEEELKKPTIISGGDPKLNHVEDPIADEKMNREVSDDKSTPSEPEGKNKSYAAVKTQSHKP